ncbi:MAG: hypothetical protein HZA15_14320 [Nitrospirae bacterium]|nr:hypothetical protein [Nitrospirota bacterium]
MKIRINSSITTLILMVGLISFTAGCSSTQKTGGAGLQSVVTQNVVRIAGVKAMQGANLSPVKGKLLSIKLTGFIDAANQGFIENLVRSRVEDAGGRLVAQDKAAIILEVVVNSAGNDFGTSRVPVISRSERTEGTVDMDLVIRNAADGEKLSSQHVVGEAKYEQTAVLGIEGMGNYYVKEKGSFTEVPNPSNYR